MDIFEKINSLEILNVLDNAGIQYKKDSGQPHMYTLLKEDGRTNNSFKVNSSKNIACDFGGNGEKGGPFDFIGRYLLKQDTQTDEGRGFTAKWFVDKGLVENPNSGREFKKSLNNEELLDQYDSFKLNGYKSEISSFLMKRGLPHDFIQKNHTKVGEIFKDIGYYDNYYCTEFESYKDEEGNWQNREGDTPKTVGVFMFPCLIKGKRVGMKLRRKDGKTIRGKKSIAIGKTGLIYDKLEGSTGYIVEGEIDYIILRLLGYTNVVGNEGGVQAHKQELKSVLFESQKIVCLYDGDIAGVNGKEALSEVFGRSIHAIDYPIREDMKGRKLSDINDFYNAGYDTKTKWDELLKGSYVIGKTNNEKPRTDFVFLRDYLEYYDLVAKRIQQTGSVSSYLGVTNKELFKMVGDGLVPKYRDLCYREGGQEGYFNTLNESIIVKHGGDCEPILHNHIKLLINNICGSRRKNVEWIHKAILYKLTHINDVNVPAVILYGVGGSGKGTFLNLLSKIFGEENTQVGLGQKELESSFDSFSGNKIIVEFKEVSSGNTANDRKILDRIKSFVCEPVISVRTLHKDSKKVNNIGRFHLSSNHAVPIQLDSKHSGNRRFTIIKTGGPLKGNVAEKMNNTTFKDKTIIKQYISWLYETYPDVPEMKLFPALDNEEKNSLEESCEGVANQFFEWFENKYPHIYRVSVVEKNILIDQYRHEIGEDDISDQRYKQKNFDIGLSHRYEKKRMKIRGKQIRGYYINKTNFDKKSIPEGRDGCFQEGELGGRLSEIIK